MDKTVPRYSVNPIREVLLDGFRSLRQTRRHWPKFALSQADEAAAFFDEHGWVIFRGVFTAAEIEGFRRRALQDAGRNASGDILSSPSLGGRSFILDDRIVAITKTIVKADPCYFGDSTVSVDVRMMGFHKDNPDKEQQAAPDWRSRYSLVRVGLYLQDHAHHSGGLSLRDGSHEHVDHSVGMPLALPTEVGDVAVWSLRTTHSGNALRLKAAPHKFVPVPVARIFDTMPGRVLARLVAQPMQHKERIALFATYGAVDSHLHRYLAYLKTRQYAVQNWQQSPAWDDTAVQRAKVLGVTLLSMKDQVADVDWRLLNAKHVHFPWSESEPAAKIGGEADLGLRGSI